MYGVALFVRLVGGNVPKERVALVKDEGTMSKFRDTKSKMRG